MKVYIPIVSGGWGLSCLGAYSTYQKAEESLADWCREHASEADLLDHLGFHELQDTPNEDIIRMYFESESIVDVGEIGSIEEEELDSHE